MEVKNIIKGGRPVEPYSFEKQQERDMALRQYCKEHKIKLVEIPFYEMGNIEDILTKELKIHKNKS